ncbi:hypothetical protein [Lyngbya sp. CCY1209]|nr:hypothetical protein [Lyngbya sp. CCY1209]
MVQLTWRHIKVCPLKVGWGVGEWAIVSLNYFNPCDRLPREEMAR